MFLILPSDAYSVTRVSVETPEYKQFLQSKKEFIRQTRQGLQRNIKDADPSRKKSRIFSTIHAQIKKVFLEEFPQAPTHVQQTRKLSWQKRIIELSRIKSIFHNQKDKEIVISYQENSGKTTEINIPPQDKRRDY